MVRPRTSSVRGRTPPAEPPSPDRAPRPHLPVWWPRGRRDGSYGPQLDTVNRREFVSSSAGWIPFLRRNTVELSDMRFHVRRKGHTGRRSLHIHGNEETA